MNKDNLKIGYKFLLLIKSKNSERKITNHLQQDVKISAKQFLSTLLVRRFDENTTRWLREPGQMSEIKFNLIESFLS